MNRFEHMSAHDLAILAEHLSEFARSHGMPPSGWPDVAEVDIAEFADQAFACELVDDLGPFVYRASPATAVLQRKQIGLAIGHALMATYRRPLNGRDIALISGVVVQLWDARRQETTRAAS